MSSICGCGTINYIEPTTGDLSRVRFATNDTNRVTVNLYDTPDCKNDSVWMTLRNGVVLDATPKSLGIPLSNFNKNAFKEFKVESNKEKVIVFWGITSIGTSAYMKYGVPINLSFLKQNKDYELLYTNGAFDCSVAVSEISTSAQSTPQKTLIKILKNSQNETSNSCMARFKAQKLNVQ